MKPAEARTYLAEVQAKRGVVPTHAPVTSMDQLVAIVRSDEVGRFEETVAFLQGKPGIDALSVHATIELAWSDALTTVAALAEEFRKRAEIEETRLGKRRDGGEELSPADARALDEASQEVASLAKTKSALRTLAEDHLRAASVPVAEAMRQFEKDPRSYRVAAFYYLLGADWKQYDKAMTWFEGYGADAGILYLRAMESLKRYGVRKDAREYLEQALEVNPALVRAQAKLVLVEEGIDEMNVELQKLQAMAPSHVIVKIAGPAIKREYAFSTSLPALARRGRRSLRNERGRPSERWSTSSNEARFWAVPRAGSRSFRP
jgi:tetratricopeptide (TPR) repeat protein